MRSTSCIKPYQQTWDCLCIRGAILDIEIKGKTALMIAEAKGHKETAEILRRAGKRSLRRENEGNNLRHGYFKKQLEEKKCL